MPDFIPRPLPELLSWAKNASEKLSDDPERFGVTPELAQEFADRFADFALAMQCASAPATRTTSAISVRNDARKAMVRAARRVLNVARAYPDLDATKKIELGLSAGPGRNGTRRKVGPPTNAPAVQVRSVDGSTIALKLANYDHPSKRGLARDITHALVFAFVGENPPADMRKWRGFTTSRANPTIDFGTSHTPFAKVWLCARWMNRRGQPGPTGNVVYTNLGAPTLRATPLLAA